MERTVRKAEYGDLPRILEIYAYARSFMAATGNPNQWGKTNPPRETLERDILIKEPIDEVVMHYAKTAKNAGMDTRSVIFLGGQSYVFFPWLGTRAFRTVRRLMQKHATELGISDIQSEGCCYITFKSKDNGVGKDLADALRNIIERDGLSPDELVFDGECPIFDKFDEYIPAELLRDAYATDRLCPEEVVARLCKEGGPL